MLGKVLVSSILFMIQSPKRGCPGWAVPMSRSLLTLTGIIIPVILTPGVPLPSNLTLAQALTQWCKSYIICTLLIRSFFCVPLISSWSWSCRNDEMKLKVFTSDDPGRVIKLTKSDHLGSFKVFLTTETRPHYRLLAAATQNFWTIFGLSLLTN